MQIGDLGGMVALTRAAAAGNFAVDPATGHQLIGPLSQMHDAVAAVLKKAATLDRPTPLGDLDEARAISALNQQVVAGDNESLVYVLQQFKESVEQVTEAVRLGMANYAQVDARMREAYEQGLREQQGARGGQAGHG